MCHSIQQSRTIFRIKDRTMKKQLKGAVNFKLPTSNRPRIPGMDTERLCFNSEETGKFI
jgi:hypothetical protein